MTDTDGKIDKLRQLILHQFKEVRKENKEAICNLKKEILEKIEKKMDKNEKEAEERILEVQRKIENVLVLKFDEIQLEMKKIGEKVGISTENLEPIGNHQEENSSPEESPKETQETEQKEKTIPIKEAILGKWKREMCFKVDGTVFMDFRDSFLTVQYDLENGKTVEKGDGLVNFTEGDVDGPNKLLYVENNHLKTNRSERKTTDRYFLDGKLHIDYKLGGEIYRAVYKKMIPIREEILGKWQMAQYENIEVAKRKIVPWTELNETLEFKLEDWKLLEIENGRKVSKEGVDFFVDDSLLISHSPSSVFEQYISDGKLHRIHEINGRKFKEIYRRVPKDKIPIEKAVLGEWQLVGQIDGNRFTYISNFEFLKYELMPDGKLLGWKIVKNSKDGRVQKRPAYVGGSTGSLKCGEDLSKDCLNFFKDGSVTFHTVDFEWLYEHSTSGETGDRFYIYKRIR